MLKQVAMLAFAVILAAYATSLWVSRPAFDDILDSSAFEGLDLAPVQQAVTLARAQDGKVLLVTAVDAGGITGIDIGASTGVNFEDAVDAYTGLGRERLLALLKSGATTEFTWDVLGVPVNTRSLNIAAGTNFREHAREVGLDEKPFLFPKLSAATAWDADVTTGARLDYEIELCGILLTSHTQSKAAKMGYTLCGDYTDRWVLVKQLDLDGKMGRTGFAAAKGGVSRMPLGPLLVIPTEENFYQQVELRLYLNDSLRQQALASEMVWSPQEIIVRALADCKPHYLTDTESMALSDCSSIPAKTVVLTGTPAGVLFNLASLWNPQAYLGDGDVVTSFGTYLGFMRNKISTTTTP